MMYNFDRVTPCHIWQASISPESGRVHINSSFWSRKGQRLGALRPLRDCHSPQAVRRKRYTDMQGWLKEGHIYRGRAASNSYIRPPLQGWLPKGMPSCRSCRSRGQRSEPTCMAHRSRPGAKARITPRHRSRSFVEQPSLLIQEVRRPPRADWHGRDGRRKRAPYILAH